LGILLSPTHMDNCIKLCIRSARACEECSTACLQEPEVQARIHSLQILKDCAEICLQVVSLLSSNS